MTMIHYVMTPTIKWRTIGINRGAAPVGRRNEAVLHKWYQLDIGTVTRTFATGIGSCP